MSSALASFIAERLPGGLPYPDAAALCVFLYSVEGVVPTNLAKETSREALAATFSELSRAGWVSGNGNNDITDKGHWLSVVGLATGNDSASILVKGQVVAERLRDAK
jgi:hypothetical protein